MEDQLLRELVGRPGELEAWQERWWDDPGGWVLEHIQFGGDGPTAYQLRAMRELPVRKRICIRSLHTAGKTAMASWIVLWFASTREGRDWKIATTASAWRQLTKYLWPEIRKWTRRLRWERIPLDPFRQKRELMDTSLKLSTGEAFALASKDSDAMEGAHATHILYLFDEAKVIPDGIFDAAEGALATTAEGEALALAISTPGEPQGRFHDIQTRKRGYEDWWTDHWTLEDAIAAGRVTQEWADQRKEQWGESSAVYQNRVLGEFAVESMRGIPLAWIEAAIERWKDWRDDGFPGEVTTVGVDVGGGGEGADQSIIAVVCDHVRVREIRDYPASDPDTATMELTGAVAGLLNLHKKAVALVDSIGIGAGVLHRLREQRFRALGFVASKSTQLRDESGEQGFANWRAAGWWTLRELMAPDSGVPVCLPDDDELTGDLTTPGKRDLSGGRILIESKEDIRKRIGRSTNRADAVIHAVVGPHLCREETEPTDTLHYEQPVQIGARF